MSQTLIQWKKYGFESLGNEVFKSDRYVIKRINNVWLYSSRVTEYLQEIKILYHLRPHPSFITLNHIIASSNQKEWKHINMVFDAMDHDLSHLIQSNELSKPQIKNISKQIICGLYVLHNNRISHGDMKPQNILYSIINNKYNIKICDFGSANINDKRDVFIGDVNCTYGYKSPEIILQQHQEEIASNERIEMLNKLDEFGFGCIFLELNMCDTTNNYRQAYALFEGLPEISKIIEIMGVPSTDEINKLSANGRKILSQGMPKDDEKTEVLSWEKRFPGAKKEVIDLIRNIFVFDMKKRYDINDIIRHEYFKDCKFIKKELNAKLNCRPIKKSLDYKVRMVKLLKRCPKIQFEAFIKQKDNFIKMNDYALNDEKDEQTDYKNKEIIIKTKKRKRKKKKYTTETTRVGNAKMGVINMETFKNEFKKNNYNRKYSYLLAIKNELDEYYIKITRTRIFKTSSGSSEFIYFKEESKRRNANKIDVGNHRTFGEFDIKSKEKCHGEFSGYFRLNIITCNKKNKPKNQCEMVIGCRILLKGKKGKKNKFKVYVKMCGEKKKYKNISNSDHLGWLKTFDDDDEETNCYMFDDALKDEIEVNVCVKKLWTMHPKFVFNIAIND